ncbi:MAG: DUF6798 domain-containing protein [Gemmatimonadota bacterium]
MLFTLLFVAGIGIANGGSNQVVYLLPGLHAADPNFLAADWFVGDLHHPHGMFTRLVAAIAATGRLEIGLAVGAVLQSVALALAIWSIARESYDEPLLPWAFTLVMLGATGTRGIGLTLLVPPQLEASAIAGVSTLVGVALLGSGANRGFAGLAFGAAALFHINFAVLLVPIVGTSALVLARREGLVPALSVLVPFLAFGTPGYLQALEFAGDPAMREAALIDLARFPHHFDPRTWGPASGLILAAVVAAGGAGYLVNRPRFRPAQFAAVGMTVLVVAGSLLVGYAGLSIDLMLAFPWRLSTLVIVFAVLAVAGAIFRPPGRADQRPAAVRATLAAVAAAALFAAGVGIVPVRVGVAIGLGLVMALRSGWGRSNAAVDARSRPRAAARDAGHLALLLVAFVPVVWHGLGLSHLDIRPEDERRSDLYAWARNSSPDDAVFAVPPGWIDFRLVARRAVVADHKSPPVLPDELAAWVERLRALTGIETGAEAAELDTAFLAADCLRLRLLSERYRARYAIRRVETPPCGHVVYSDAEFAIVELPETLPVETSADRPPGA